MIVVKFLEVISDPQYFHHQNMAPIDQPDTSSTLQTHKGSYSLHGTFRPPSTPTLEQARVIL